MRSKENLGVGHENQPYEEKQPGFHSQSAIMNSRATPGSGGPLWAALGSLGVRSTSCRHRGGNTALSGASYTPMVAHKQGRWEWSYRPCTVQRQLNTCLQFEEGECQEQRRVRN